MGYQPAERPTAALPRYLPRGAPFRVPCAHHNAGGTRRHNSVVPPVAARTIYALIAIGGGFVARWNYACSGGRQQRLGVIDPSSGARPVFRRPDSVHPAGRRECCTEDTLLL